MIDRGFGRIGLAFPDGTTLAIARGENYVHHHSITFAESLISGLAVVIASVTPAQHPPSEGDLGDLERQPALVIGPSDLGGSQTN
jgi:hypothetical protein